VPKEAIIGISQGWKMVGAVKTAERRLAEGTLLHGGQPIMAWCVGNARVEPRGNAIIITKQASGSAKIDPLMALFDAVSLMSLLPELDHSPPEIISLI
jgi:phage terminase large subunit-like protein